MTEDSNKPTVASPGGLANSSHAALNQEVSLEKITKSSVDGYKEEEEDDEEDVFDEEQEDEEDLADDTNELNDADRDSRNNTQATAARRRYQKMSQLRNSWAKWHEIRQENCKAPLNETIREAILRVVRAVLLEYRFGRGSSVWVALEEHSEDFDSLFFSALALSSSFARLQDRAVMIDFVSFCFQNLEVSFVRRAALRTVNVQIWRNLGSVKRIEIEFERTPSSFGKHRPSVVKAHKLLKETSPDAPDFASRWLSLLIGDLVKTLKIYISRSAKPITFNENDNWVHLSQIIVASLRLLSLLCSMLPCRRFVLPLILDHDFMSLFADHDFLLKQNGKLKVDEEGCFSTKELRQEDAWLLLFRGYVLAPINPITGDVVPLKEVDDEFAIRARKVQGFLLQHFGSSVEDVAYASLYRLCNRNFVRSHLAPAPAEMLVALCDHLGLRKVRPSGESKSQDELADTIACYLFKLQSPFAQSSNLPIYPSDEDGFFAARLLPPFSLQYLSITDYLFRHYTLYHHESVYSIFSDIEQCVARMKPEWDTDEGCLAFNGYSPMSLPVLSSTVSSVGKASAFDSSPSHVELEVKFSLENVRPFVAREWNSMSRGEVVFLVKLDCDVAANGTKVPAVRHVRGALIERTVSHAQHAGESKYASSGSSDRHFVRVARLFVDRHHYASDLALWSQAATDRLYTSFDVIVRRSQRENFFWASLEAIRECMGDEMLIPAWYRNSFLGYGLPSAVHYSSLCKSDSSFPLSVVFYDTFLDEAHVRESFPDKNVVFKTQCVKNACVTFEGSNVIVRKNKIKNPDAKMFNVCGANKIRFSENQIEAIKSGTLPGLTLIVGPPGTGKTDIAVQILCNLYHGNPKERVLLVTHGNMGLNQIFDKLVQLNHIPERHLLRLGHADDEMSKYGRFGRVEYFMDRRKVLLEQALRLATSMGAPGEHAISCEAAYCFFQTHVKPAWRSYECCFDGSFEYAVEKFPFSLYYAQETDASSQKGSSIFPSYVTTPEVAMKYAKVLWRQILALFADIKQAHAFEVLRGDRERANLLIAREARIVAMTTTYAAIKRRDIIDLGFQFETFLMEEAGTVMESETFVALAMSKIVKRVVLIGDHKQLPPVVQCPELTPVVESLFTRMVRLGMPTIELKRQGRSRPSICALYEHVYGGLKHYDQALSMPPFNPGFEFEYQFVDVSDYNGQGESSRAPHVYQNRGEAEYVVSVFQYMRLRGYPASSIAILTTYNGQRDLISEVLSRRCASHAEFYGTCVVSTVDRFQGQQSDFVLLSLVRTRYVGHLADARRFVVAMSRARKGLYVFGRWSLFARVADLSKTFDKFAQRPRKLAIRPQEEATEMARRDALIPVHDVFEMNELVSQQEELRFGAN